MVYVRILQPNLVGENSAFLLSTCGSIFAFCPPLDLPGTGASIVRYFLGFLYRAVYCKFTADQQLIIMCIFCDQYTEYSVHMFTLVALNQPTMTPLHDSLPTYSDSLSSCEGPAAPAPSLHGCDNRLHKRFASAARVSPPRCSPT